MRPDSPRFGVAGFPPNFFSSPFKKRRENIFSWLDSIGLDWVELQNTYGVKMKDDQAKLYKELSKEHNIGISIHGPYFISLASKDQDVVLRSKNRILQCIRLASMLDSNRIIFHPGCCPDKSQEGRKDGIRRIVDELLSLRDDIPKGMYLYPETAGKKAQLGSVSEIIEICEHVDFARPCLDMAHIHGFESGSLMSAHNIRSVFDRVEDAFGKEYLRDIHIHMYPVEYDHNGEKKHKAFADLDEDNPQERKPFYPQAEDFITVVKEKQLSPVVICEARDTQDIGALLMKELYMGVLG